MGKKRVMLPVEELDLNSVKYEYEMIQAPHLTGSALKLFINLLEFPLIGRLIISSIKKKNKMTELFRNTVIPEPPMYKPEYPPQEPEQNVIVMDEDDKPEQRVAAALNCLPEYDPSKWWNGDNMETSFRYWNIRDFAYAYRARLATPSRVAENIISALEELHRCNPSAPLLIAFDLEDIRKQAAASTERFEQGKPMSVLDGTFVAIKDDIDLYPYPSNGGSTWFHEVRLVKKDAVCVSRLRSCGVILIGKANMHEFGLGTTGNNPNYGTARNPHAFDRYTGGSSSGPAALVASGLCSAALGTDGGGSVRIPSALCGLVGLKTTYGRTDMRGALCDGTVEIIGPLTSTVEDAMLVYAAILGSSPADKISMKPSPPCFPDLTSRGGFGALGALRLGKYSQWFNDVHSDAISVKCEEALKLLSESYGCQVMEIVIPEMHEMRTAHVVSIGSESLMSLTPYCEEGRGSKLTYDTRTNLAIFRSFTAADYVAAQRYRRRLMYYHMEIFKKVDVIVTPTTGMTAPMIPPNALQFGESNLEVSGYLMRFVVTANLLGFPAITVPVGYDKDGLPIGLQLIGRPWAEASLLRLASAVEGLCGHPKKRPAQYYDIMKGT